jgi:hypothetical protein
MPLQLRVLSVVERVRVMPKRARVCEALVEPDPPERNIEIVMMLNGIL